MYKAYLYNGQPINVESSSLDDLKIIIEQLKQIGYYFLFIIKDNTAFIE